MEGLCFPLEASEAGGNPSTGLEGMEGVVQKEAAMVPNLEAGLRVEQVAGCTAVPMVAFQEVELSAPMEELKQKHH